MSMHNDSVAARFEAIADLLEVRGEVVYKILSYRRAAESIRALGRELEDVRREEGLESIPGVGKAIAAKLEELLDTGTLSFYERLTAEVPASLLDVLALRGIGPKSAGRFWRELGVTNLDELEQAAQDGRIRAMKGMGARKEEVLLENIAEHRRVRTGRMLLDAADTAGAELLEAVQALPGVVQAQLAGSLRRRRETIGDLDVVAAADNPAEVLRAFTQFPMVLKVLSSGASKASVVLGNGVRAQLWTYPPEEFGSVLQYATGSQAHNVRLREFAQKQGLSLSEHGFQKEDGERITCAREEDVYRTLDLAWVPPELREDRGELETALPALISMADVRADLHTHTTWSDGRDSLAAMAAAAYAYGLRVLAVTDHSSSLPVAGGLSAARWEEQHRELDDVRREYAGRLSILHGAEVEILADGSLDFADDLLARMDIVIASLHVGQRGSAEEVTARVLKAMANPYVDILAHPTGRLLGRRDGMALDLEAVFRAAAERRVALEINAHPERLDLSAPYARRAVDMGCLLAVNSDSHRSGGFANLPYGVSTARRGWVQAKDVVNTWHEADLRAWLARRRA